jgi:RND family efflux transporter MFP subunit
MNGLGQIAFGFISVSAVILSGCDNRTAPVRVPPVVTGLHVAQTVERLVVATSSAMGTVRAKETSMLSVQTTGRVTAVAVREGDAVRAGQVLLTVDNAQARFDVERSKAAVAGSEEAVKVAETEAALAASTLQRYELLRDHKAVSPQEFDEVNRKAQGAAARLDAARAQNLALKADASGAGTVAGYARLTSPFAGFVTARHVDPGAMATPGMALLEVEKAGTLQLTISVDESLVKTLRNGMAIPVQVDALTKPALTGHVAEIDPAGDPSSHSFIVKIDLPAVEGLRSGMFGAAAVGSMQHTALLVPAAAIVTHGSLHAVWVLDSASIASLRYVTLGSASPAGIEVLSGLSPGETVVLDPADRELGGSRVEVRP